MDKNYFKSIQGVVGASTLRDSIVREAQDVLADGMSSSINNDIYTRRNGMSQRFVVTPSQVRYKYKIETFPKEELFVGDIIDYMNEQWIVVETSVGNPLQTIGLMWLCNIDLCFQNGTPDILSYPAVLDSGVYSTTKNGNEEVQYVDKQFKLYLPYNEDTSKIYVDKRIAVDTRYDKYGKQILEVYEVTGTNRVARSYGKGGHLLVCELRSGIYSPERDNVEHMICDYVPQRDSPARPTKGLKCEISGRPTISLGQSRTYISKFYDVDGIAVKDIAPVWSIDTSADITSLESEGSLKISVNNLEDNIGECIRIELSDSDNLYDPCVLKVEVSA